LDSLRFPRHSSEVNGVTLPCGRLILCCALTSRLLPPFHPPPPPPKHNDSLIASSTHRLNVPCCCNGRRQCACAVADLKFVTSTVLMRSNNQCLLNGGVITDSLYVNVYCVANKERSAVSLLYLFSLALHSILYHIRYSTHISIYFLTLCRRMSYICHTAPLTYRRYILNIYSTNIRTEYFKHTA
jgi:hypothetical protein